MPVYRRLAGLLAMCSLLLTTSPAAGWTRTSVRGTGAHLDIGSDGVTRVVLTVRVNVGGGWISHFDIEGLDPELVLDADKPVWLEALSPTDEQKYLPTAELKKNGRVRVSFANRKLAPWRGDYELGIVYTTLQPVREAQRLDDGVLRVRWAMPTWPASLENVRVEVNAPAGSVAASDGARAHVVTQTMLELGDRTVLSWDRIQLPRTVSWEIGLDVPESGLSAAALPEQAPTLRSVVYPERPDPVPLLLALGLLSLCLLRRMLTLLRCRREGLVSIPLLPVGGRIVRGILLVVTAVAGGIWIGTNPLLGIVFQLVTVLLALDRRLLRARPERVTARAATERDFAGAYRRRWLQHLEGRAWLDGSTLLGGSALLSLWALALYMDSQLGAATLPTYVLLMATPLWFNGGRHTGPPPVETALLRLKPIWQQLCATAPAGLDPIEGARVMLSVDERDRPIGAHLALPPTTAASGLRTLELVAAEVRWIDVVRCELAWRVVAQHDSPAARQAAQALTSTPRAVAPGSGDTIWLAVTRDPVSELPSLLAWLTSRDVARVAA